MERKPETIWRFIKLIDAKSTAVNATPGSVTTEQYHLSNVPVIINAIYAAIPAQHFCANDTVMDVRTDVCRLYQVD